MLYCYMVAIRGNQPYSVKTLKIEILSPEFAVAVFLY